MTLQDLLSDCYRRCQLQATPPAEVQATFRSFINETQDELASDPALRSLLRGATTLTSVAGVAEYGVAPVAGRILTMRDTTHRQTLRPESRAWYRQLAPSPSQFNGTPDTYVLLGPTSMATQPSTPSVLFVKSTSATDTQTVRYEVVESGGYTRTGDVDLTGTTGISIGAITVESVVSWQLKSPAAGIVTLLQGTAFGAELARIPIGMDRSAYQGIALMPTPSSAVTYQVEYERIVGELVTADASPAWLPESFHRLLAIGARRRYWEDQGSMARYNQAVGDFLASVTKLKADVNNPPDQTLVPGGRRSGRSDLGSEYPNGTVWD